MQKILLIIPAYNEEENILNTVNSIEEYNKKVKEQNKKIKEKNKQEKNILDYIVINDGSKDNTLKILQENNINHINLIINLGIGGAVQTGYKYAYANDYDIAIQFDGDGQHDVNYVEKLIEPINNGKCDLSIGTRYLDKTKSAFQSTAMRRFGSKLISMSIKRLCNRKITDPTSGFRAANKKVIKYFAKEYPCEYPEPESSVSLLTKGYKIEEVSVSMNERIGGVSSINPIKSVDYMAKVLLAIVIDTLSLSKLRGEKNAN